MFTDEVACDLSEVCRTLFKLAQKYTPASAFADVTELTHIAKIMESVGIQSDIEAKHAAKIADHVPAIARQSADYRRLQAQFKAALSTIADMGSKENRRHKNAYYEGVYAGLRRAARVAIIFLNDINGEPNEEPANADENCPDKSAHAKKPRSRIVR